MVKALSSSRATSKQLLKDLQGGDSTTPPDNMFIVFSRIWGWDRLFEDALGDLWVALWDEPELQGYKVWEGF